MCQKIVSMIFGLCLLITFSCEVNRNPIASNSCADTTDGHWWDDDSIHVRKPNIYIYPAQKMNLALKVVFPQGGSITESIPLYNDIWNIEVEPSGLIDNQYTFLYYECKIADQFKYNAGWQIKGTQLENFFRNNLSETGFIESEIKDFVEYWIPRLESSDDYLIYPQFCADIDPFIELQFSNEPESLLRLLYVIETKQINDEVKLPEPVIPEFVRKGFTVTEWGVILK
ncbi:MAG: hypothetical protein JW956_11675 [Calditrichaceae bacterium]|nr:hypothetical protein [Calditrichaceae bacterium]